MNPDNAHQKLGQSLPTCTNDKDGMRGIHFLLMVTTKKIITKNCVELILADGHWTDTSSTMLKFSKS